MCNDNTYGLTASTYVARALGVEPPCVMQNDYSIMNRRIDENGLSEASSPINENVGFMAYNVLGAGAATHVVHDDPGLVKMLSRSRVPALSSGLGAEHNPPCTAGGMLTGKYLDSPAAVDETDRKLAAQKLENPRGRMDLRGWGRTLYRYRSEPAVEATRAYANLAKEYGMSLTELSLRWVKQRGSVTTSLLGQTSLAQVANGKCVQYVGYGLDCMQDCMQFASGVVSVSSLVASRPA